MRQNQAVLKDLMMNEAKYLNLNRASGGKYRSNLCFKMKQFLFIKQLKSLVQWKFEVNILRIYIFHVICHAYIHTHILYIYIYISNKLLITHVHLKNMKITFCDFFLLLPC